MMVFQACLDGLLYSGLYIMLGLGFFLTFSVLRRVDLSFGTVIMVSIYLASMAVSPSRFNILALLLSCLTAIIIGFFVGSICFGLVRGDPRNSMAATLGVWMALEELIIQLPGHGRGQFVENFLSNQGLNWIPSLRFDHTIIFFLAITTAFGLYLFLRYTKIGLAIRTLAFDPDTAALMGISRKIIVIIATSIAAAIGALAGYLFAMTQHGIDAHFGMWVTIKGLVILFISGATSIFGIIFAALILGIGERLLTELFGTTFREVIGMTLMCLIIAFIMGNNKKYRI